MYRKMGSIKKDKISYIIINLIIEIKPDNMTNYLKIGILLTGLLILVLGCSEKIEIKQESQLLNSFSMNINDQKWQPSVIGNDSCSVALRCEMSTIHGDKNFYTITMYKDSQSKTSSESENIFRLQIMDVISTGSYPISDPFGDFNTYARFVKNESGNQQIYDNSTIHASSMIQIEELIPKSGSALIGIKGSFSGILYNSVNPKDSIIIDNCLFNLKKLNRNNFCQCAE